MTKRLDRPVVARVAVVLVALAAGRLVIAGLRAGAGTIGPVFLALVLTIAVHPAHAWARRHGWPAWAAILLSLALVYLLLFGLSFAVLPPSASSPPCSPRTPMKRRLRWRS